MVRATFRRWFEHRPFLTALAITLAVIAAVDLLAVHLPRLVNNTPSVHPNYSGLNDPLVDGVFGLAGAILGLLERHEKLVMALATIAIACFTGTLWWATKRMWEAGEKQISLATKAANAAKESADAAVVSAMPILSPYITRHERVHPRHPIVDVDTGMTSFDSVVFFTFENYGKTPGIVREVRADLFVTDADDVPAVNYDTLHLFRYEPIIPGDAREGLGVTSVMDRTKNFTMSRESFAQLQASAVGQFKRVALIGRVVYDDFFGLRHTRTFCVKLRIWWDADGEPKKFQGLHGGAAYNRITRQKAPENNGQ